MDTIPGASASPEKPHASRAFVTRWTVRIVAVLLAGALTLALSFAVSASVYESANSGRIYPGVTVFGMNLSGLSAVDAAQQMDAGFDYPRDGRIVFTYGDKKWVATPGDLGLGLDLLATTNNAYSVGRSKDMLGNAGDQLESRFSGVAVAPVLQFDFTQALAFLQRIAPEVEQPAIEARLEMHGLDVVAVPGQVGKRLDMAAILPLIAVPIGHLTDAVIPMAITEFPPRVLDASPQAAVAQQLLSQDFAMTIADSQPGDPASFTLTPAMLADMLSFRETTDSKGTHYLLALDEEKLVSTLRPLAGTLSRKMQNARYHFDATANGLALYIPSKRGRELNVDKSIQSIQDAVAQGAHGAALAFDTTEPDVGDQETAAALGITGLLPGGMQWTSFAGSAPERIQNITLASAQFDGLLVKPGEAFSMGAHLGDVSLDTGYAEALIIVGNRTIKGAGGGVCQVSTTLFRTILMTGFPITERYSHAYRVGYYENSDGPVHLGAGFDATVFFPEVDLKFINDSPYWILMETQVDTTNKRLYWRFYSTSDGRIVSYNSSGVTNEVDPPDPKWEANPQLNVDWTQVDWAVKGADVTVNRSVSRNGQVINQDRYFTHYLPWGAVCQYNPDKYTPSSDKASCPP
ncbi:MAG TPA: VanW family protein [Anaerolineales bacterium]